jgi:hypothetical protein
MILRIMKKEKKESWKQLEEQFNSIVHIMDLMACVTRNTYRPHTMAERLCQNIDFTIPVTNHIIYNQIKVISYFLNPKQRNVRKEKEKDGFQVKKLTVAIPRWPRTNPKKQRKILL